MLLCGLPGAGKSTFARSVVRELVASGSAVERLQVPCNSRQSGVSHAAKPGVGCGAGPLGVCCCLNTVRVCAGCRCCWVVRACRVPCSWSSTTSSDASWRRARQVKKQARKAAGTRTKMPS